MYRAHIPPRSATRGQIEVTTSQPRPKRGLCARKRGGRGEHGFVGIDSCYNRINLGAMFSSACGCGYWRVMYVYRLPREVSCATRRRASFALNSPVWAASPFPGPHFNRWNFFDAPMFHSLFHIPRPFRWPHCRAGRRGKDSQGSVVLMRSRFEDCIEAHRLLLSPMDGIQSQFK